jgi:ATP-independent RNA helicase DbpA
MTTKFFAELDLPYTQLANLASLGYEHMTPIQAEALPFALKGDDVIGQAKTGSGKTAAFGIPLLRKLDVQSGDTQAIVLCPTRELSIQVSNEIRKLARYQSNITVVTLYGGQAISLQKSALRGGAHVVVGTPGRVKDHLLKASLVLDKVKTLVLDEADRMLEMGFLADIGDIIKATPAERQTLLFSATFPENIRQLSEQFQRSPARVSIESRHSQAVIEQKFFICPKAEKLAGVAALLSHFQPKSAIIFCNTKFVTKEVHEYLLEKGFSAATLHGDMEQRDREEVLMQFKHQSRRVLVATDVAARGLDIEDLTAVINYETPLDPETYVHRIGRTGRAGKVGYAISLVGPGEQHKIAAIQEFLNVKIAAEGIETLAGRRGAGLPAEKATLCISGGRKHKLRAGDILGALTGEGGLEGKAVGKIDVMDYVTYVSVDRKAGRQALLRLSENKIKGQKFKTRIL